MMSLFTSFDLIIFYKNLLISFLIVILMMKNIFFKNLMNYSQMKIMMELESFFLTLKEKNFNKSSILLFNSMFLFLFFINFTSIFPFNFAISSQVSAIMFTSITIWISMIMFSMKGNLKGFISHLTPEGTPIYLVWFLFMIEIISNFIRPITLTVRLVANILAGHLLMILLAQMVMKMNLFLMMYLILNTVEIFVSLIQSYIFSTMLILYFSEI